jgi:hypothetical protein
MCVISFFPFFYFSFLFFSISILYYLYYYIKAARCSLPPPGSTSSQSAPSICPCSILALEAIPRWSAPPSLSTTPIALGRHPPFPSPPTVSPLALNNPRPHHRASQPCSPPRFTPRDSSNPSTTMLLRSLSKPVARSIDFVPRQRQSITCVHAATSVTAIVSGRRRGSPTPRAPRTGSLRSSAARGALIL